MKVQKNLWKIWLPCQEIDFPAYFGLCTGLCSFIHLSLFSVINFYFLQLFAEKNLEEFDMKYYSPEWDEWVDVVQQFLLVQRHLKIKIGKFEFFSKCMCMLLLLLSETSFVNVIASTVCACTACAVDTSPVCLMTIWETNKSHTQCVYQVPQIERRIK